MPKRPPIILVPVAHRIEPETDEALRQLERRGYVVERRYGISAIDHGRCMLATYALAEGFDEIIWIDADVSFRPEAVERLRSHGLPFVAGIYAKKKYGQLATELLPGTSQLKLGQGAELIEVWGTPPGFLYTRRELYEAMRQRCELPMCDEAFDRPVLPFFLPMVIEHEQGHRYLTESYAFCERVRRSGHRVMADPAIRLFHIGTANYSWEEAGQSPPARYDQFTMHLRPSWMS
jgi:hypothetical protein